MRHFLTLQDLNVRELKEVLALAAKVKRAPKKYAHALERKTLLAFFEKPSVRTRISFETGMTQLGGHAIYYDVHESTIGKKETVEDFARVTSRYADFLAARVFAHEKLERMSRASSVPVINMLSDGFHPCQTLADLLTIQEHCGALKGKNLAYAGDARDNVAHSLLFGGAMTGMHVTIACPKRAAYQPNPVVVHAAKILAKKTGAQIEVLHDAKTAVQNAHVVYTDTWMSYNVPPREKNTRTRDLRPYQVNAGLMKKARKKAVFMHCLPAKRENEVTSEVLDGKQSVVFDQAENRLHAQKALLLWLAKKSQKAKRKRRR